MDNASPADRTAAAVIERARGWLSSADEPEPWLIETSGSTGVPKQVVLSRGAMVASAELSARRLGASGAWVLALAPGYVAGLNVIVRSLLAGHTPAVLGDRSLGDAVAELPEDVPAFISLVPTQLSRLLEADQVALQRFHTVLLGGGPIDPALRARAAAAGVTVVATYGSAETSGGCVYDGVPLDGVALAIADDGRLRVSGPVLADGYVDPELSAELFRDGWFLTSDAARFDADGHLQVLGRIDDMVISGGVNVPAPAVAARLRLHPDVAHCEVLGVPDDEWGTRLVAFVEMAGPGHRDGPSGGQLLSELRDWVAVERPRSWAPRQLVLLETLPMLPNGKVDRVRLREIAVEPQVDANNPQVGAPNPQVGASHQGLGE